MLLFAVCFNVKRDHIHSLGGIEVPEVNSVPACMDSCAARVDCLGFDIRRSDNACFIHPDPVRFNNRFARVGVDQYVRTGC